MKLTLIALLLFLAGIISFPEENIKDETIQQKKGKKPKKTEILTTNTEGIGMSLELVFEKGEKHNHPLMAVWVEDTSENYIQTLFVAKSIATSIFNYGDKSKGHWTNGVVRRPAALPYWSHKRGMMASDGLYMPDPENPVPDAYTGATPSGDFILQTLLDNDPPEYFDLYLEINQPWDWNDYWTNNKFPGNEEYKTSSQPSVVYQVRIDNNPEAMEYQMKAIGHGHYAGEDGSLNTDLTTLSTALEIAEKISVLKK